MPTTNTLEPDNPTPAHAHVFYSLFFFFIGCTRETNPTFAPFIVSDCGELAPKAYDVQEWIVSQYRLKCCKEGRRADGYTTADRVRQFRHRLKIGVQTAVACGLGTMMQFAGMSWRGLGPA